MAVKTLIYGASGTGKSRSMKAFAENGEHVAVVNPVNKPLPFRNNFEMLNGETEAKEIITFMKSTAAKVIVVDDFQYVLAVPYMRRIKERGWEKFDDLAKNYYDILDACDKLPENTTVYFVTQSETLDDGKETVKLIGKQLRDRICVEGLFTVVLKTLVSDSRYYFTTQNNGKDTVKSPEDMFPSYAIDNDLKYVDEKIRNYYSIGDHLTDEEMKEKDEEAKKEEVQKDDGKKKRKRNSNAATPSGHPADSNDKDTAATGSDDGDRKKRNRRRKSDEADSADDNSGGASAEATNGLDDGPVSGSEVVNSGLEEAGDRTEVPFDEVKEPKPARRRRKVRE